MCDKGSLLCLTSSDVTVVATSAALADADIRVQQLEAENTELMHKLTNIASSLPVSGPAHGGGGHDIMMAENSRLKEQLLSLNKLNKGNTRRPQVVWHLLN